VSSPEVIPDSQAAAGARASRGYSSSARVRMTAASNSATSTARI